MPTRAAQSARRETTARRRQAADALRLVSDMAGYSARQLADGLSPQAARLAALEAATAMEAAARKLRALTGRPLTPADARSLDKAARAELAAELVAAGWTRRQVAGRLAVHPRTVGKYLAARK